MNRKWLAGLIGAEKAGDTSGNVNREIVCYTKELDWNTLATWDVDQVVDRVMGHLPEIKNFDPICPN